MGKNTSVSIGEHFEKFIDEKVKSGRYSSKSDVIRDGLRLLEEREEKIVALRRLIQEGLDSGIVEDFNFDDFIAEMKQKHKSAI